MQCLCVTTRGRCGCSAAQSPPGGAVGNAALWGRCGRCSPMGALWVQCLCVTAMGRCGCSVAVLPPGGAVSLWGLCVSMGSLGPYVIPVCLWGHCICMGPLCPCGVAARLQCRRVATRGRCSMVSLCPFGVTVFLRGLCVPMWSLYVYGVTVCLWGHCVPMGSPHGCNAAVWPRGGAVVWGHCISMGSPHCCNAAVWPRGGAVVWGRCAAVFL